MKQKKGDVTVGTLVAIILGIVVLVFVIVGFTSGWNNFLEKINIFGNTKSNIGDYEIYCSQACALGNINNFCHAPLSLVWEGGYKNNTLTCFEYTNSSINKNIIAIKNEKDNKTVTFIVESCSAITCPSTTPGE